MKKLLLYIFSPLLLVSLSPFLPISSKAQAFNDIEWYDVDSLHGVLSTQDGKERIKTLNFLAASLSFEDAEKSNRYASEALTLAEKLGDRKGVADATRNFGRIRFYEGDYPQALNYYQEAFLVFEELGDKYMKAQMLEDIATTHFYAGNYDKTFELVNQALAVFREKNEDGSLVGNVRDTMTIYSRVGLPYRIIGRSDISLSYYLNYLHIGEKNNFEVTDMLVHTGLVAMCYYETGQYDSALYYFKLASNYPDVNMSIRAMKNTHLQRMAAIYLDLNETDTAISYLAESLAWFSKRGFLRQSQVAARRLGDIYFSLQSISDAEKYYLQSEALLKEMISLRSYYRYDSLKYIVSWGSDLYLPFTKKQMVETTYREAISLYNNMYNLYLKKDQLRQAMNYLIVCSNAKDTLRELARNRESVEIQTKYETMRKDVEITELNEQNEIKKLQLKQSHLFLFGLGGLIILIVLFAIILIRHNHLRNSQQKLMLQQKLLRSQMNPHFLFNSLTSIQNFIIREDSRLAADYLSRFSKLVRHILDSSTLEMVSLEDEIETIENYLALQKVRYRELFDYKIEVDEIIDTESLMIPPMLTQPFIENAIEHGIKHKDAKGHIQIRCKRSDDVAIFEVEDDGIGRQKALEILKQQDAKHKSLATEIARERIAALNRRSKKKITLEIIDLKDEAGEATGTLVRFCLPLT